MTRIRRLGAQDLATLHTLAIDDADFGLAEDDVPTVPLGEAAARQYLADPSVLHWVAEADGQILGHLQCQLLRRRAGAEVELLLYDIGVRQSHRRRGIGAALLDAMAAWMGARCIRDVWVLAGDQDARRFYESCGFEAMAPDEAPTYLLRKVAPATLTPKA